MRIVVIIAATAVAACGGPHASATDAASIDGPASCWPDIPTMPQGTAVLGTNLDTFEAMPDVLPLEFGAQDGFDLVANVRMTGFTPGNPQNVLDPTNPRTRIRAFFDDTNIPLNYYAHCPFRLGYVPTGVGDYQLVHGVPVVFETCWRADRLIGARIRIELELLDDNGGYTTDVKVVTAGAPTSTYPMEQNTPGCVH